MDEVKKTLHEAMFQELREQVANDGAADDQTKAMIIIGLSLLEQTLSDLRRSADALERLADCTDRIRLTLENRG